MKRTKHCIICTMEFTNSRLNKYGQRIGKYTLAKWETAQTCSVPCYRISRRGMRVSTPTEFRKGSTPWNKGLNGYMGGPKNANWKGGVTGERHLLMGQLEYKLWRKSVFERDDYTCQICNKRGVVLHADHLKPWALYPELRYAIDNGRTLCVFCHRQTDTYGDLRGYRRATGYVD